MNIIKCTNTLVVSGPAVHVRRLVQAVAGEVDGQPSGFVIAQFSPLPPCKAEVHDEQCCYENAVTHWGCGSEARQSSPPTLVERGETGLEATFRFITDGQPPIEALSSLALAFPELKLDITYREPRYLGRGRAVGSSDQWQLDNR